MPGGPHTNTCGTRCAAAADDGGALPSAPMIALKSGRPTAYGTPRWVVAALALGDDERDDGADEERADERNEGGRGPWPST